MSDKKKHKWLIKCDKCNIISTSDTNAFYCDGCRLMCKACGNIVNRVALMKIRGSVAGSPTLRFRPQGPVSFWFAGIYARCKNSIRQRMLRRELRKL